MIATRAINCARSTALWIITLSLCAAVGLLLAAIVAKVMAVFFTTLQLQFDANQNCGNGGIPEGAGGGGAGASNGLPPDRWYHKDPWGNWQLDNPPAPPGLPCP